MWIKWTHQLDRDCGASEGRSHENGALISPEEGHTENVLVTEAWDEVVHHPAEYKTVHHEAEYKHHDAVYETVHHPEEGHYELLTVCSTCGYVITSNDDAVNHLKENPNCVGWRNEERWVVDTPAWDEQILVKPEWDELIKEAWDEQVSC